MKAYCLFIRDNDDAGQEIVFADTPSGAKKQVGDLSDSLEQYIDLGARRAKQFDGMENLTPAQLGCKQWRDGWQWFDMDAPDPDTATDKEFIEWYESNF